MKYNFVPVFDTKMKKRRSIAPHLAKDANYLLKMGFELIEGPPEEPRIVKELQDMGVKVSVEPEALPVWVSDPIDTPKEYIEAATIQEKPKRGRPKKQS